MDQLHTEHDNDNDNDNWFRILVSACNAAISLIHSELPSDDLQPCGLGVVQLHSALTNALCRRVYLNSVSRSNDLLRLSTTKLHAFPYREVPLCWRRLYTDASILKAVAQINTLIDKYSSEAEWKKSRSHLDDDDAEIVRTLDMALIMTGAPGDDRRETIEELLADLDRFVTGINAARERGSGKRRKLHAFDSLLPSYLPPAPELMYPIDRLAEPPSIERFQSHLNGANTPMIISNLVSHWPALTTHPWSSASYLLSKTHRGKRLVPVELGKSYITADWSQKIMTFREFINTHVLRNEVFMAEEELRGGWKDEPQERPTGYLAQHTLFTQIPKLRTDILTPDYCYTTPPPPPTLSPPPPLEEPIVNAWFGPSGTISPLHTDPYSNILTQVLGRKYIRLYAPSETSRLFPRGIEGNSVDMSNTSQVDIDDDNLAGLGDESRYREWTGAQYVEGVLGVGEGLYIPVRNSCPKLRLLGGVFECRRRLTDSVDMDRLVGGIT